MKEFKKSLEKFQSALNNIKKHNIRRTIEGKREYILGYQIVCSCGIRTADYVGEQQAIDAWMRRKDD